MSKQPNSTLDPADTVGNTDVSTVVSAFDVQSLVGSVTVRV